MFYSYSDIGIFIISGKIIEGNGSIARTGNGHKGYFSYRNSVPCFWIGERILVNIDIMVCLAHILSLGANTCAEIIDMIES